MANENLVVVDISFLSSNSIGLKMTYSDLVSLIEMCKWATEARPENLNWARICGRLNEIDIREPEGDE